MKTNHPMSEMRAAGVRTCTRCLYPETKPDLTFNAEDVCSACIAFDKRKQIDWATRKRELEILLEKGRNSSGYDCIVPSSGGKDSTWQVLTLLEMGAKPLIVTATTCHLTNIGRKNIDNLARYATTVEFSPNKTVRAKINRIGLLEVGDISWPEHVSIFTTPFRAACDFGIPLIFYGECPQEAYGGPPGTEDAKEMTQRWVQEFGGFLGLRPSDLIGRFTQHDMTDYMPPAVERLKSIGVHGYFLGQFFEWDSHRNAEVAKAHGMTCALPSKANLWDSENLDNAQTGIHDRFAYLKFGYGRATAQIGVDIRNKRLNREGHKDLARALDRFFPYVYAGVHFEDMLSRIGVTVEEYFDAERRFMNRQLFDCDASNSNAPVSLRAAS